MWTTEAPFTALWCVGGGGVGGGGGVWRLGVVKTRACLSPGHDDSRPTHSYLLLFIYRCRYVCLLTVMVFIFSPFTFNEFYKAGDSKCLPVPLSTCLCDSWQVSLRNNERCMRGMSGMPG